jgi:hypothetical protein
MARSSGGEDGRFERSGGVYFVRRPWHQGKAPPAGVARRAGHHHWRIRTGRGSLDRRAEHAGPREAPRRPGHEHLLALSEEGAVARRHDGAGHPAVSLQQSVHRRRHLARRATEPLPQDAPGVPGEPRAVRTRSDAVRGAEYRGDPYLGEQVGERGQDHGGRGLQRRRRPQRLSGAVRPQPRHIDDRTSQRQSATSVPLE